MICPQCGRELGEFRFCPGCGSQAVEQPPAPPARRSSGHVKSTRESSEGPRRAAASQEAPADPLGLHPLVARLFQEAIDPAVDQASRTLATLSAAYDSARNEKAGVLQFVAEWRKRLQALEQQARHQGVPAPQAGSGGSPARPAAPAGPLNSVVPPLHDEIQKKIREVHKPGFTMPSWSGGCGCALVPAFLVLAVSATNGNLGFDGVIGCVVGGFVASYTLGGIVGLTTWQDAENRHSELVKRINEMLGQAGTLLDQAEAAAVGREATLQEQAWNRAAQEFEQQGKDLEKKRKALREECDHLVVGLGLAAQGWGSAAWSEWQPAEEPHPAIRLGALHVGPAAMLGHGAPSDNCFFDVPAVVPWRGARGLLFNIPPAGDGQAALVQARLAVESILARMVALIPPGKARFTFFDPVGLGENVAAFMGLDEHADEATGHAASSESLVDGKAWSEPQHIEQRLGRITEHLENVIQKYLRKDHATLEHYNASAGEVAEPYRVVVAFDFPANFNETAARRLVSIARGGPRCGVFPIVVADLSKPRPYGFNLAELEDTLTVLTWDGQGFRFQDPVYGRCRLDLDGAPPQDLLKNFVQTVSSKAPEAMRVEVPFSKLLERAGLGPDSWWKGDSSQGLEIPMGPFGAKKVQWLKFGQGTSHHALLVGRPGSGKSNLMHILVTSLALRYDPTEVELYLIDFKKGVEFKAYADMRLPHARVIAIESEREFGLSVLQGLDAEMEERGRLYRAHHLNDISDCLAQLGRKLPRILLLVDEFQEFFSRSDSLAQEATLLLDRLVRQGRAFGIHVLLGSQSLAGSSAIPRSTIDQMAVRIAMQCSEADSRLILADDNPAARLLSRPGEAIYNASSGLVEGNKPFQVALFTDEDRKKSMDVVSSLAASRGGHEDEVVVFEGHEPAHLRECRPLRALLGSPVPWAAASGIPEIRLGEPIAIKKPPVTARLRKQGGANVLIVTREEAQGAGLGVSALLDLAAQHAPDRAEFHVVDFCQAETPWSGLANAVGEVLPHTVKVTGRRGMAATLRELAAEIESRNVEERSGPALFLIFLGLHRARDLRDADDLPYGGDDGPTPSGDLARILREGPEVGAHSLLWCDAWQSLSRVVDRRLMNELGIRVAGPMSHDDSQRLLDDGAASQLDRPNRMVFYDEDRPGHVTVFRPYGLAERDWLLQVAASLARAAGKRVPEVATAKMPPKADRLVTPAAATRPPAPPRQPAEPLEVPTTGDTRPTAPVEAAPPPPTRGGTEATADPKPAERAPVLSAEEWLARGEAAFDAGRWDDALECFAAASRLDDRDPVSRSWLGMTLYQQDRHAEAREAFRGAVTRDPSYPPAWLNLGLVHLVEEDLQAVRQCIRTLRALDPPSAERLEAMAEEFQPA